MCEWPLWSMASVKLMTLFRTKKHVNAKPSERIYVAHKKSKYTSKLMYIGWRKLSSCLHKLWSKQRLFPEFFLERVLRGGGGVGRVPNSSSQPDFSPNPSYQICNPISSARLLTDAHHEVKALIDAIWIMNLHSPRPKKITHPAGEHSSSSNPCWHHHIKTTSVFCTILIQITVFTFLFFAAAVIITLRTSAGSLRSKSFRPRSSRKLGREHNNKRRGRGKRKRLPRNSTIPKNVYAASDWCGAGCVD